MMAISKSTIYKIASFSLLIIVLYLLSKKNGSSPYVFSIIGGSNHNNEKDKSNQEKNSWLRNIWSKLFFSNKEKQALIKELEENKEKLYQKTYFDKLTKLPNRMKLRKEFNAKKADYVKYEKEVSVFLLDIDRFRIINDLYGRGTGDAVIRKVAQRLRKILSGTSIIARESEDEIFIMIEDINAEETSQFAEKIVDLFRKPFEINEYKFYVTASIGISRYPETANDIDVLFRQAENAMFKVKKTTKNNYHIFRMDDADALERKRHIEFGLKEASLNHELYLVYQPKVIINTGEIYGVEALLRWEHSDLGLISPGEFIPIAEESGMINEIGYWVIHEAVRQTKDWHEQGKKLSVAVNVSAMQFEDPYFVKRLKNVLTLYELEEEHLNVEITESIMKDVDRANKIIKELHDIGVSVAIDDFGTGYSSLSVLNNMFIDTLKIDKSFIDNMLNKKNTASLVKIIIEMSKTMNFKTVAEGIETMDQLLFLKENHCEYGQGYYFSKPILPAELIELIDIKEKP